jgi:hypothetical protein
VGKRAKGQAMREVLEFVLGAVIVAAALADIFSTILVPGPVSRQLRVVLQVRRLSLPVWRYAARRRAGDARPSNGFAPFTFVMTFTAWMLLLLVGFALLMHAVEGSFSPGLRRFDDALWVAGSSLLTLGVSEYDANGIARWLVLAAALSGFSALTASITFLLQVQSGLHQREPRVLTLVGIAGSPPSGLVILETAATLADRKYLDRFFLEWRDWAAATLHSHLSYPVLCYYRSSDEQNDWLTALEAVLDAAALVMAFTDDPAVGAATLMHRTGSRTASALRASFDLDEADDETTVDSLDGMADRLRRAGYSCPDHSPGVRKMIERRGDYAGHVAALATHLGASRAALLPHGH